ncbi:elongation factor P maturation arginine rhamnosyltransferase EarP [Aestuariirhabdus litorea]|uniref:Protein-arginine rhamnosyltransferase n=1 Tax=Aestuariirhabdus litorea TaxID=2528527 RepID=A0A3P3VJW9_9GAMM|nr:elongation factor P maturation arginine rhamnosyltransferase EarP [Aestuariirhabdus litorea]RRJ83010.1 elongation factor P maturation arginine rhamnosyltransferase EarP [Aestuariirhabdus litorea]RWW93168.1 elongation factor P maturation arginine rhamnosyltransferase EarP [Endozoicomonadaceae bacterium GTF-13]
MHPRWDIFCRVIDNFGDIGVCWRLARQLAAEYELEVRLWVDEPAIFFRLCPEAAQAPLPRRIQGVQVHHWTADWVPVTPADLVIEAFGCTLPSAYIKAMALRPTPVLWINLEYLSAESWVEGCHGLPSPQGPGLYKYFFFPGFSEQTGGLLRESGLIEARQRFQQGSGERDAFLARLGIQPAPDARLISLFCYENPALASWLDQLARDPQPSLLLVPEGRVVADIGCWLGRLAPAVGECLTRGNLSLQLLPFLSPEDYDHLLWSCDLNLVRGEDSFVRAQWAGKPFLWQIYPQQEGAHLVKLEAFLQRYTQALDPAAARALEALWQAWNQGQPMAESWSALQPYSPRLAGHAEQWSRQIAGQKNSCAALVQFFKNWSKFAPGSTPSPFSGS